MRSMTSTRARLTALALLGTLPLLFGCPGKKPPPEAPPAETAPTAAPREPAPPPEVITDFKPEAPAARDVEPDPRSTLKTVYFDYDQDALSEEARATLLANAQWLRSRGGTKVRIEGNADDRGTIEYNLALGQRRADSVRAYLGSLGVNTVDLEVISYGEEKPAADGSDDTSWSQNRRADFVVLPKP